MRTARAGTTPTMTMRGMGGTMECGIDLTCWANRRGYGRFTRGLVTALLASRRPIRYTFFIDEQLRGRGDLPDGATYVTAPTRQSPTEAASASGRRSLRDMWVMARTIADRRMDVIFFPSVYTYVPMLTRTPMLLGIHDVIAEDHPDLVFPDHRQRRLWAWKSRVARAQATAILTVSEHAKRGIVRRFRRAPGRVLVVDEAPDPTFRPLPAEALDRDLLRRHGLGANDRFLLYLGGINPHKNLSNLVRSVAALRSRAAFDDLRLVIIGDIHGDVFTPGVEALRRDIRARGLVDRVHFTGFVPDGEAVHFYNAAQAVVLPSVAEGFGLPAVEGAACGTPVVATRNSPLPQLLQGGGLFIDPCQPDQLTEALARVLGDDEGRRQMGETARQRASHLTWERSARQMERALHAVAQGGR